MHKHEVIFEKQKVKFCDYISKNDRYARVFPRGATGGRRGRETARWSGSSCSARDVQLVAATLSAQLGSEPLPGNSVTDFWFRG